jgi:hypothetical protein
MPRSKLKRAKAGIVSVARLLVANALVVRLILIESEITETSVFSLDKLF